MRSMPIKLAIVFCLRGVILVILIYFVLVYQSNFKIIKVEKTPGIIYMLQWTPSTTEPFEFMGIGVETFWKRNCRLKNCFVTGNRNLLGDVRNFDVILFHGKEIIAANSTSLPKERSPEQIYVFSSMESAGYYPVHPNEFNGYFNLTWTYKLNSDIYFGYLAIRNKNGKVIGPGENIRWLSKDEMLPLDNTIKRKMFSKNKAAAWFVSNCKTPSKRFNIVEQIQHELKKHGMSVDVFGRCGDMKCPRSSMHNCLKLLQTDYYFYLAFENSFAEDYVTEKLLYALKHYTVPVVFGGANYKRFLPEGSYLDATKLRPQKLVREMVEIISFPQKYHDFFKWHNHYSYHEVQESAYTDPFCKLCEYINIIKMENKTRVIDTFESWWNPRPEQWIRYYKD